MFRRGYLTIGRLYGAPIKLHWSIPIAAFVFCGFRWSPGFIVGFTLLILTHELGHAAVVRFFGLDVQVVEVTGLGGACHWAGNASPFEESLIAWGGVFAQLLLLGATLIWLRIVGAPTTLLSAQVASVFYGTNLWLIAINLVPVRPLDGARAWRIFSVWRERAPRDLPYGTWRDHSHDVQRQWYDRMQEHSKTPVTQAPAPIDEEIPVDRPLSPDGQRAIDELLRHTTGEVPARRRDGD